MRSGPGFPAFATAEKLRAETVVRFDGRVRKRPEGTDNAEMPTGEIELYVREIEVLGPAGDLPLPVFGDQPYPEETRLRYRFLDLRREKLHKNIVLRGKVVDSMRSRMKEQGFSEFQTPILTASSPEGARDFLVPSRIHPGKFYALPQAPQQYKQLLMMAGFDRYFQIAPCFRDEDPRADRLPGEFYQLDIEMSFVEQEDVFAAMEPVIRGVFEEFSEGKPVTPSPWPRIPYAEAIKKYGSDKPDLRNPIVMQNVSEAFRGSGFKLFARLLETPKNEVWAIPAPGGGQRTFADRMNSWAQGEGQPGLGYILFFDRRVWREMPGAAASSRNRAGAPSMLAATTRASAAWPSSAKCVSPSMRKPAPSRHAAAPPASCASETMALPAAMRGSHVCCCSCVPPSAIAVAARTAVDRNGESTRFRAISRATSPAPTTPNAVPPRPSGTSMPLQPISPHSAQNSREKPSPPGSRRRRFSLTGAFAAAATRTLSDSRR